MSKVMRKLSDVTVGGRYEERPDGTIVRVKDQAGGRQAPPATGAEGGPGEVVGAISGNPPARPEADEHEGQPD